MMTRCSTLLTLTLALAFGAASPAWAKPSKSRPTPITEPAAADEGHDDAPAASRRSLVAPSSRAMFATFSLAPAFGLSTYSATQLKLAQSFGYHVGGGGEGFAIGAEIQESLGGHAFAFNVGPKAWYDFAVARDLGVYIAPTVMMGLGYASVDGYWSSVSSVGFDMQFGVDVKVVLADRGLVFVRPVTIDIAIGDAVALRYDLVFGGGVTF